MKVLILSGGYGTRLWPLSRRHKPKQLRILSGDKTLFDATYDRVKKIAPPSDIYILTTEEYASLIREDQRDIAPEQFLIEPFPHGNAAATLIALLKLYKDFRDDTVFICSADSYIKNEEEFVKLMNKANEIALEHRGKIILICVQPSYPETGYGYIKLGKELGENCFQSGGFIEKPNRILAEEFMSSGGYVWNTLLCVSRIETMIRLYRAHCGEWFSVAEQIAFTDSRDDDFKKKMYASLPNTSIDYALFEKTDEIIVLRSSLEWCDIGHWQSIKRLRDAGIADALRHQEVNLGGSGVLVYSDEEKLVATIGISDVAIIDTKDVLLVCSLEQAQMLKALVKKVEEKGLGKYL